ncbi:MAG: HNH endonuclease signature motif containing protein [Methylococcaceae bacterium]
MRPVERGDVPIDENGNAIQFKEYSDARNYLIKRLGDYCSYCESPLLAPAVEHIQPKSLELALKTQWDNFLLACPFCNSIKGNKLINASNFNEYFWADCDNTFRAFCYEKDRAPSCDLTLNVTYQKIAQNTLELTGLDREPTHKKLTEKDRRWIKRNEAWSKAELAIKRLNQQSTDLMREQIIDAATSTGFWSVWMTVFADDVDMRQRLISEFRGTSAECFDAATEAILRNGGQI